jgi:flavin reductase (DIM6/NTAB) family NADH-FMN oxidoreductase RutF
MDGLSTQTYSDLDTCASEPVATSSWNTRDLRNALGGFATGVTVVTARSGDGACAGVTVNSFCSVSLDPPLVLWCLCKTAPSCRVFLTATHFAIHVLAADQQHLSARFSKPSPDKFAGLDISRGLGGAPLLNDVVALFECRAQQRVDAGDHYIMLGRVDRYGHTGGRPLVFHSGGYRKLA